MWTVASTLQGAMGLLDGLVRSNSVSLNVMASMLGGNHVENLQSLCLLAALPVWLQQPVLRNAAAGVLSHHGWL